MVIIERGNEVYIAKATNKLLTGGTISNIFTIINAPILLVALIMEIKVAVSANNCNAKLVANPTVGIDTDMCSVVDIISAAIGDFFHIDGTIANAMIKDIPGFALPLGIGMDIPLIIPVGAIDLNLANSDPSTGAVDIYLRYKPLGGSFVLGS